MHLVDAAHARIGYRRDHRARRRRWSRRPRRSARNRRRSVRGRCRSPRGCTARGCSGHDDRDSGAHRRRARHREAEAHSPPMVSTQCCPRRAGTANDSGTGGGRRAVAAGGVWGGVLVARTAPTARRPPATDRRQFLTLHSRIHILKPWVGRHATTRRRSSTPPSACRPRSARTKLTIAAVADAAGTPVGSIYHRYASRDDILAALWLELVEEFQARFLAHARARRLRWRRGWPRSRFVCRWVRRHPREARLMLLHRREDFAAGSLGRRPTAAAPQTPRGAGGCERCAATRRACSGGPAPPSCAACASRSSTCRRRR